LDIGVLVNNVGQFYTHPEFFHIYFKSDDQTTINDMINCNIISVTKMTAIVLPGMVKKKVGIIINNGSGAGRSPVPLNTVYSATKAYVDFFSR
jgi:17beta-estradiol 17-dehydrogenase / very-long-chain 3-oxoacyl-CoA reductase